jgi:hypothetical protein
MRAAAKAAAAAIRKEASEKTPGEPEADTTPVEPNRKKMKSLTEKQNGKTEKKNGKNEKGFMDLDA